MVSYLVWLSRLAVPQNFDRKLPMRYPTDDAFLPPPPPHMAPCPYTKKLGSDGNKNAHLRGEEDEETKKVDLSIVLDTVVVLYGLSCATLVL